MISEIIKKLAQLSRREKICLVVIADLVVCLLSLSISWFVRTGELPLTFYGFWSCFALSALILLPIMSGGSQYLVSFRHGSFPSIFVLSVAFFVYAIGFISAISFFKIEGVPRSIGIMQPPLLFYLFWAVRKGIVGLWNLQDKNDEKNSSSVMIYGAGNLGVVTATAIGKTSGYSLVGFIDDDSNLQGVRIHGSKVFSLEQALNRSKEKRVNLWLLAFNPSVEKKEALSKYSAQLGFSLRLLPRIDDLASGKVNLLDDQSLTIASLIEREARNTHDKSSFGDICGKAVLVTGAGGSIGSELSKQIFELKPQLLVLVDNSEYNLYALQQWFEETGKLITASTIVEFHLLDAWNIENILINQNISAVFHSAAYKHVPLLEEHPVQAIRNNTLLTFQVTKLAVKFGVGRLTIVSTDKAVRPTNVMGASKRLAEILVGSYCTFTQNKSKVKLSIVRFGNVLGSSGSVIPKFIKQIRSGGPITLTHPDITRYFMTIEEAAGLVIQASMLGDTAPKVFVLDMGAPVKIKDMAQKLTNLLGRSIKNDRGYGDISIEITGLRPGEKLYEELFVAEYQDTKNKKIFEAQEVYEPWERLAKIAVRLEDAVDNADDVAAKELLKQTLHEYQ